MNRSLPLFVIAAALLACGSPQEPQTPDCSADWQSAVDRAVVTGDGMGHGPDIGSDEWMSVVEFRLGVRGAAGVPERSDPAWCGYIQDLLDDREQP